MPDTVDQCSITLAPTATAAKISSSGMFLPHTGGQVVYRSDTIMWCSSAADTAGIKAVAVIWPTWAYLVLIEAGFVEYFERRERFGWSVFFCGHLRK